MSALNSLIQTIKGSESLAIKAKANELKAKGMTIFDLSIGEPDIDTPEHVKEAARKALTDGFTKYTPTPGILPLREALAKKLVEDNGLAASPDNILVTNGGKQALHECFEVLLEPGDEVLIPAPFWFSYPAMVSLAGGRAVIVPTDPKTGYKITPAQLRAALTPRTKVIVLNSPSNPTGGGYSAQDMVELGKVIEPSRAIVLSDEVYEKITFGDFKFVSFAKAVPELAERTVTVQAFSKTYAMTGWRVGYATGPKEILGAMTKYHSQTVSSINSISQYAALAALKGPHDFLPKMVAAFERRLSLAAEIVQGCPGLELSAKPVGAFYLYLRIEGLLKELEKRGISGSAAFASYLMEQAGVATIPGDASGDDGAIRISVGAPDEVVRGGVSKLVDVARSVMN